jgi:hypothetical protein
MTYFTKRSVKSTSRFDPDAILDRPPRRAREARRSNWDYCPEHQGSLPSNHFFAQGLMSDNFIGRGAAAAARCVPRKT